MGADISSLSKLATAKWRRGADSSNVSDIRSHLVEIELDDFYECESSSSVDDGDIDMPVLSAAKLSEAVKAIAHEDHFTLGENGEVGFTALGVGDPRVALFYRLVRGCQGEAFRELFRAVSSKPDMLVDLFVLAFQTRDPRGGKGERALFHNFVDELYAAFPDLTLRVLPLVPEFGCWRDVVAILERHPTSGLREAAMSLLCDQLTKDGASSGAPSLAAKWAPREGRAKSALAKEIATRLFPDSDCPRKLYRQLVAGLNKRLGTVEIQMSGDKWDEIQPGSVPGKCLANNRLAFQNLKATKRSGRVLRSESGKRIKCGENFLSHALKAVKGEAVMHGAVLHPHEITRNYMKFQSEEDPILEAQWVNLRSQLCDEGSEGSKSFIIPLVDVSGSMNGEPMEVAIALGIMLSETTHPSLQHRVITFETDPQWFKLEAGQSLYRKVQHLRQAPWGGSTNFEAAMQLVLDACDANQIPGDDVKSMTLAVFSDMQFNVAESNNYSPYGPPSTGRWATSYTKISQKFADKGYEMPHVIFWNLRGDTDNFPAEASTPGVSMLSGFSSSMLKPFLNGDIASLQLKAKEAALPPEERPDAYDTLRVILDNERYNPVRDIVRQHTSAAQGQNAALKS